MPHDIAHAHCAPDNVLTATGQPGSPGPRRAGDRSLRRTAEREARRGERLRCGWMRSIGGAVSEQPLRLGHPALRRAFQRVFYAAAREAHHVFREAATSISSAARERLETELAHFLDQVTGTVVDLDQEARRRIALAAETAPVMAARYPPPGADATVVRLSTPTAVRLFELARRLDGYLLQVETLHLNGLIGYAEYDRALYEGKRTLRCAGLAVHQAASHVRRTFDAASALAGTAAGPPAPPTAGGLGQARAAGVESGRFPSE